MSRVESWALVAVFAAVVGLLLAAPMLLRRGGAR